MTQWKIALRSIGRRPGFSATVVLLLALGIGTTTALFSVVYTVIVKPLPYSNPEQLVTVLEATSAGSQKESLIAPGRLEDWNRLNRTFTVIAGSYAENVTDTSGAEPERLSSLRVSPRYFAVFAVQPLIGRTFGAGEERAGGPRVAVISFGVWTRRYGQAPDVIGRQLVVGGKGYAVVGVMPKSFANPSIDLWIPAQTEPFLMQLREARFMSGIGRMKPGIGIEQARADLARVQRALGEQFPKTDKGWSAMVRGLKDARLGTSGKPLLLLFAAVAMLLLVTVTNIASLMLAQLVQRQTEFALRASLGATRGQVLAPVMREVIPLAFAGALCGFGAAVGASTLLATVFADMPRMVELQMDWRALAFAIAAGLVAVLGFGLLPALSATNPRSTSRLLRAGGRGAGPRQRLQQVLVASQIAVTMVLLASTGLLLRSFFNLRHVDLGFNPHGAVTFHVGAAWDEDRSSIGRLQERLIADLGQMPGVQAAGLTNFLPASGGTLRYQASVDGLANTEDPGTMPVGSRTVSPGYLRAIQATLVAGAWCPDLRTDFNAPRKVMVNRRFVDIYAGGANVVGRRLRWLDLGSAAGTPQAEIVGVVGDMKEDAVGAPAYPYVYSCAIGGGWPDPEYVVRASGEPQAVLKSIRELVHRIDPSRAVFGARPLEAYLDGVLDRPRSNAQILALFAVAAMTLASVGLYGLVANMVNMRRREIGVRVALGAQPGQIVRTMVGGVGRLIGAGILAGVALMAPAQAVLRTIVFGVAPLDGPSLAAAAGMLAAVSGVAAYAAGRRAASVNPIEAIRAE